MPKEKKDNMNQDDFTQDEDFDLGLGNDDDSDDLPSGEPSGKGDKRKPDDEWAYPGKYKTVADARQGIKKQERYIKHLEAQLKDKKAADAKMKVAQQAIQQGVAPDTVESMIDQIPDDDFIVNPRETIKKVVEAMVKKHLTGVRQATTQNRWNMLQDRAMAEYPDFDIETNEKALFKYITRYSPEYRREHGYEVLAEAIERLGGKKRNRGDKAGTYSETGSAPSPKGGKQNAADVIKNSILKAKGYESPIAKAFNR